MNFYCKQKYFLFFFIFIGNVCYSMETDMPEYEFIKKFLIKHSLYTGDTTEFTWSSSQFVVPTSEESHAITRNLFGALNSRPQESKDNVIWDLKNHTFRSINSALKRALIKGAVLAGANTNSYNQSVCNNDILGDAINENDIGFVTFLLGFGANPNAVGFIQCTHMPVFVGAKTVEMARLLVYFGALLEIKNKSENPMLWKIRKHGPPLMHYAVTHGTPSLLLYYIQQGVGIHQKDGMGNTPLHIVCDYFFIKNELEKLEILLENGADPHMGNKHHLTPTELAFRKAHNYSKSTYSDEKNQATKYMNIGRYISCWKLARLENDQRSFISFFVKDIRNMICELVWRNEYNEAISKNVLQPWEVIEANENARYRADAIGPV